MQDAEHAQQEEEGSGHAQAPLKQNRDRDEPATCADLSGPHPPPHSQRFDAVIRQEIGLRVVRLAMQDGQARRQRSSNPEKPPVRGEKAYGPLLRLLQNGLGQAGVGKDDMMLGQDGFAPGEKRFDERTVESYRALGEDRLKLLVPDVAPGVFRGQRTNFSPESLHLSHHRDTGPERSPWHGDPA